MDTCLKAFLDSIGWELHTGCNEYKYVVSNSGLEIELITVGSFSKRVYFKNDPHPINIDDEGSPFYGWGNTPEEALESAGYYLRGYLH